MTKSLIQLEDQRLSFPEPWLLYTAYDVWNFLIDFYSLRSSKPVENFMIFLYSPGNIILLEDIQPMLMRLCLVVRGVDTGCARKLLYRINSLLCGKHGVRPHKSDLL